jgi:hypothetical protein
MAEAMEPHPSGALPSPACTHLRRSAFNPDELLDEALQAGPAQQIALCSMADSVAALLASLEPGAGPASRARLLRAIQDEAEETAGRSALSYRLSERFLRPLLAQLHCRPPAGAPAAWAALALAELRRHPLTNPFVMDAGLELAQPEVIKTLARLARSSDPRVSLAAVKLLGAAVDHSPHTAVPRVGAARGAVQGIVAALCHDDLGVAMDAAATMTRLVHPDHPTSFSTTLQALEAQPAAFTVSLLAAAACQWSCCCHRCCCCCCCCCCRRWWPQLLAR